MKIYPKVALEKVLQHGRPFPIGVLLAASISHRVNVDIRTDLTIKLAQESILNDSAFIVTLFTNRYITKLSIDLCLLLLQYLPEKHPHMLSKVHL
jgi:hypothetical protein